MDSKVEKHLVRLPQAFAPTRWLWEVRSGDATAWGRSRTREEARQKLNRARTIAMQMGWK